MKALLSIEYLILEYQQGSQAALERIVHQTDSMIKSLAQKYAGIGKWHGLLQDDLEQEAWLAIFQYIDTFKRGDTFQPHAYHAAKNAILAAIKNGSSRVIKLTKNWIVSLSDPITTTEGMCYENVIPDELAGQFTDEIAENYDRQILRRDIFGMLDNVFDNDQMKQIVICFYGINDKEMSVAEIAKQCAIGFDEVMLYERQAISIIRKSPKSKAFREKYNIDYALIVEQEMAKIDRYGSPSKIVEMEEVYNNLLKKILKSR